MRNEIPLTTSKPLSQLLIDKNITTWNKALQYIQQLPYGRTEPRGDWIKVLSEGKGTCSSKHALLKELSIENNLEEVDLMLCMYKMSASNTPKVGDVLANYSLPYIPEAHCVLQINGMMLDFTSPTSNYDVLADDVLELMVILPQQVIDFKPKYHKQYIQNWCESESFPYSFEEVWNIREECIKALE